MKLENAIQQKKFNNEYHKAVVNILYTNSWIMSMQAEALKPLKISTQQFNVLRILKGQYPNATTVNLLIERMIDKNSNASRLVEKLRQKDLVERTTCKADRRRVDVKITLQGLETVDKASELINQKEEQLKNLSESEIAQLNQLLDKLRTSKN